MKKADYFSNLADVIAGGSSTDVRVVLAVSEATPREVFLGLVANLPTDWQLRFFDRDYPSNSDPGAYVTVIRQGTRYRLRHSNHGWTGFWQEQTADEVVEYLHRCRGYNSSLMNYEGHLELSRRRSRPKRRA